MLQLCLNSAFSSDLLPGSNLGGHLFYLTEREQKDSTSFCYRTMTMKSFPGFLGTQETATGGLSVHYEHFFPRTVTKCCVVYLYF